MQMTITEKILAKAAGLDSVHPGQLIMANLSMVLGNDITSPVAIKEFPKFGKKTVMEIHCSKRGKTKLVVNSKSLDENLIASYQENGYAKLAPSSYGWTLDFTIQADELTTTSVLEVLDMGVDFRR